MEDRMKRERREEVKNKCNMTPQHSIAVAKSMVEKVQPLHLIPSKLQ